MKNILKTFQGNIKRVDQLMEFDDAILSMIIRHLDKLKQLFEQQKLISPLRNVNKYLKIFKNIHRNESLRNYYETMYNQCVVLLVSYFATALEDIFKINLMEKIKKKNPGPIIDEKITLSLGDIKEMDYNLSEKIPDLFLAKNDLSFQDMKSVNRTFSTYFNYQHDRNKILNNIILGQACRHIIVHSGSRITDRFKRQVKVANPRDLKKDLTGIKTIQFEPSEIKILAHSMNKYLEALIDGLNN